MWQSSPDHCSIEASEDAVACAVAMPIPCVRIAMAEINNAFAPLLKCEDGKWVSNGLRKEAEKQGLRREQAKINATARWKHAAASKKDANASIPQCFPSLSLSLSPSSNKDILAASQLHTQKFSKPTVEMIRLQCAKIGLREAEAEKFWDFYESKGWVVGKSPMKSWSSALNNWKKNTNFNKQSNQPKIAI